MHTLLGSEGFGFQSVGLQITLLSPFAMNRERNNGIGFFALQP